MIFKALSMVGSMASIWLESKAESQKLNLEIKKKQLTGDIDWDLEAMKGSQSSWKDEYLVILFSIPLILCFCGSWGRNIVEQGFRALEMMPEWYQVTLGCIVAASFGVCSVTKFFGLRKNGK